MTRVNSIIWHTCLRRSAPQVLKKKLIANVSLRCPAPCWSDRAARHTHARAYVATGIPPVALQWRISQTNARVRCAYNIENFFRSVRQPYAAPPTGSSRCQISMRDASHDQSSKSHPSPALRRSLPALPISGPRATELVRALHTTRIEMPFAALAHSHRLYE